MPKHLEPGSQLGHQLSEKAHDLTPGAIESSRKSAAGSRMCGSGRRAAVRVVNKTITPIVRAGVGFPLPIGGGIVVVETLGRRSGLPHQVPLVSLRLGDRVVVSTLRPTSQWIRNLEAIPPSRVGMNGRARTATARVRRGRLNTATPDLRNAA